MENCSQGCNRITGGKLSISVLIVDDDKIKRDLLISELIKIGVSPQDIKEVSSAVECRKVLDNQSFDLLLLDLILPVREGEITSSSINGLELLRQIVIDGDIPAPQSIVGVTSDQEALEECSDTFRSLTSQVLYVHQLDSGWKISLGYFVALINRRQSQKYDFDVCFLTALRTPELDGILALPYNWGEEEAVGNGILVRRGQRFVGGKIRRAVCAHATQAGPVAAIALSHFMLEKYRPRTLLMTGVCGGVDPSVKLGDIVIAEKSWDWQSGKWHSGSIFDAAPDQKDADATLKSLALKAKDWVPDFLEAYKGKKPKGTPTVHVGPMVSGSSVVADVSLHEKFKVQHRKSLAVDMECYSLYFSALSWDTPSAKVICIKGISDLANRAKNDKLQDFCSHLSAYLADQVVFRYFESS